jgi:hypothetical protein
MRILAVLVLVPACTTLGPMPATTGVAAIPSGRPGFEAQAGAIPAFYLSRSAQDKSGGGPTVALSALVEPDRWIGVPGLIAGVRLFGQDQDTPGEPYLGYRKQMGDISFAGIVYGTAKRSTRNLASYHATRFGAEVAGDAQMWTPASWFSLHAQAALAATRIHASGNYCVDAMGIAKDCDLMTQSNNTMIDGALSGVFAAGTLTLGADFGRGSTGMFHHARVALLGTMGQMPLVRNGAQEATDFYASIGLTLTLGLGAQE